MAILLISNREETRADPDKDHMAVKRWQPVAAFPDGYQFARLELDTSRFMRITVDGLDHVLLNEAVAVQTESDTGIAMIKPYRRRRWRIDPTRLPPAARNSLQNTGTATVSRKQLRDSLIRVRDGAAFTAI